MAHDAGTHGGTRAVVAALLANLGIAVTKFAAFLLAGNSSMLAESIHSVADSGNQGLLLLGGKRSQRGPTPEHPFGFGRERYVYGFLVAIVLFTVGGVFALYEAYHKAHEIHLGHDETVTGWRALVPIVVLVVAIVMEGLSFRTAMSETGKIKGSATYPQFIRRAKQPELPVILLEDLAALVGLVLALVGVGMSLATGNHYWDAAGTALIGLLLVAVAVVLGIETKSLLLGEAADPAAQRRIADALTGADGIDRIIHMRTLHLGPDELLVAAKIAVTATDSAAEVAAAIDAAESAVRAAEPTARVIYLEPDLDRSDPDRAVRKLTGASSWDRRARWALLLDVLAVLVFVLVGRASHDEDEALVGLVRTLWPFAVGLAVGWLLLWRTAGAPTRLAAGPFVGISTAVVGLVLRAAAGQGVAASFLVVAIVVLSLFMTGWRGVWGAVRRAAR